jgi:hypothetical protein
MGLRGRWAVSCGVTWLPGVYRNYYLQVHLVLLRPPQIFQESGKSCQSVDMRRGTAWAICFRQKLFLGRLTFRRRNERLPAHRTKALHQAVNLSDEISMIVEEMTGGKATKWIKSKTITELG